ncbi:MAG TPA: helix-turn-helix domain-containing protein [Thermoclostridium sp.]|nr:helix-turn-helix domain-containing protein [Thermoclostridium sp.]
MLLHTDKNINEIGRMIGFKNTNSFIRNFKKLTTVTPSEYRKQYMA